MRLPNNPWERFFRWLIFSLLAFLILELILIAWQFLVIRGQDQGQSLVTSSDLDVVSIPGVVQFQESIDRPIFIWNRKPEVGREDLGAPGSSELAKRWTLAGLVNTGESTYAIFRDMEKNRQIRLSAGMELEGWSVESVTANETTLTLDDKREIFRLIVGDSSGRAESGPKEDVTGPEGMAEEPTE